jgi:hypothetical protein
VPDRTLPSQSFTLVEGGGIRILAQTRLKASDCQLLKEG